MARRRRISRRVRTRTVTRTVTRKGKSFFSSPTVLGIAYGLARNPINNATKQLTASLPLGNLVGSVGDEALLWGVATVGSMNSKGNRSMKNFFKTGQAIEAQNLARNVSLGGLSGLFGQQSTQSTTTNNDGWD